MTNLKIVSTVAELIFDNFEISTYTDKEKKEFVEKVESLWLDIPAITRQED